MSARAFCFSLILITPAVSLAATMSYEFDIDSKTVNITGNSVAALTIGGQIPAPTIRATVGDTLRATFHNHLDVTTSVHWHGVLLPGVQDGVPYVNTQPIQPGGSHTFEFPILHAGTFWYHSHTELQIQQGVYGAIVLSPSNAEPEIPERVVVFSDWTDEDAEVVLTNLKKADDFYSFKKDAVQSWDKVIANGGASIRNRLNRSFTRMGPMDLADVGYDAFLVNGLHESQLEFSNSAVEQVKLRMINGSTSSYYDVEYAGGPMLVVAADGMDVAPIRVQRLRLSTAETYDVLVPVAAGQAFELRASSIDGTGFSRLFIGEGQRVAAPDIPPPNLFLMGHMAMDMDMSIDMDMSMDMDMSPDMKMPNSMPMPLQHEDASTDLPLHAEHRATDMSMPMSPEVIEHMTDYQHLMARDTTVLPVNQPWRDVHLTLTGNMERYVWGFDGKSAREEPQLFIRKGENVRFHLSNDTMMHHPLHLHGHFFRVVNQHGARSPLKHTVNIPPMGHVMIEFDASAEEDWFFHCHNQYHMKTGMARVVSYEESSLFTPEIGRLMQPANRWFRIDEFHLMNQFMDYEFTLSDERHSFDFELDTDMVDTYEVHLLYNYHFTRYVSAFAGMETREHHHENSHDLAIAGLNITLPFLIDSEWRVDDHGDFRLQLQSEVHLTKYFGF
ncbi:MAG: multicopper oxidase domain-containing protein, partial [Gammaproteobacteria bacterium]|nr:multicopper oxidase domain-containing protein [Gammaproteobacteria bacterium]